MADQNPNLEALRARLQQACKEHAPRLDFWLYNGGTILALILSAAASLLAGKTFGDQLGPVAAVCSATAGVIIAAERALSFGARWRFHKEMENGYISLIDKIDFVPVLPDGPDKQKYLNDIWTALYALRTRESTIPGAGGPSSET
jgi:hypothetical protein